MNKKLTSLPILFILVACAITPSSSEAMKVKIEPSITFRQSRTKTYHRPSRVVRRVYAPVYVYDPYIYGYYPVETYEYVEYQQPRRHHYHSYGNDFSLKFKLK